MNVFLRLCQTQRFSCQTQTQTQTQIQIQIQTPAQTQTRTHALLNAEGEGCAVLVDSANEFGERQKTRNRGLERGGDTQEVVSGFVLCEFQTVPNKCLVEVEEPKRYKERPYRGSQNLGPVCCSKLGTYIRKVFGSSWNVNCGRPKATWSDVGIMLMLDRFGLVKYSECSSNIRIVLF